MLTDVIRMLPLKADLKSMVSRHDLEEPFEKIVALLFGHIVDVADVSSNGENALPACDGVGSDNGVNGFQFTSYILWRSSLRVVEFEAVPLRCLAKVWLLERDGQRL
jgi:hypothetical protein